METVNPRTGRPENPVRHYVALARDAASIDPAAYYQNLARDAEGNNQ